jgi:hypothetical protein
MPLKTRKIRVVGYPVLNDPKRKGEIEYVAVDAKTGAYIENQIDVAIKTDDDTGEIINAEVVIDCRDIVLFDKNGNANLKERR